MACHQVAALYALGFGFVQCKKRGDQRGVLTAAADVATLRSAGVETLIERACPLGILVGSTKRFWQQHRGTLSEQVLRAKRVDSGEQTAFAVQLQAN